MTIIEGHIQNHSCAEPQVLGFICDTPEYKGGLYYLLSVIQSALKSKDIKVVLFVGNSFPVAEFSSVLCNERFKLVCCNFLDPGNLGNKIFRILRFLALPAFFVFLAVQYNINVFSHSESPCLRLFGLKSYNWIPDLQFYDLPDLFSLLLRIRYYQRFLSLIVFSDILVFSSFHAFNRCVSLYPFLSFRLKKIARIVRFCPPAPHYLSSARLDDSLLANSGFRANCPFLFLPNQFWQHKNHFLFLEAFNLFHNSNPAFQLVLTGKLSDFRNHQHILTITRELNSPKLKSSLFHFESVNRNTYSWLLSNCTALINPSLYEGWSTTVEEAIAYSKPVILSDLSVNLEQCKGYPLAFFFDPYRISSIINSLMRFVSTDLSINYSLDASFAQARATSFDRVVKEIYLTRRL